MVKRKALTKKQKIMVDLLDKGYSVPMAARAIGLSHTGGYDMVAALCRDGYIMKDPLTKSPIRYYKPMGGEDVRHTNTSNTPYIADPDCKISTVDTAIRRDGIYYRNPPKDAVRWHMADGIYFTVRKVGSFDSIVFCGRTVGSGKITSNTKVVAIFKPNEPPVPPEPEPEQPKSVYLYIATGSAAGAVAFIAAAITGMRHTLVYIIAVSAAIVAIASALKYFGIV